MVNRCSIPCSMQTRSKMCGPRKCRLGPGDPWADRRLIYRYRLARCGWWRGRRRRHLRKAAPSPFLALSWNWTKGGFGIPVHRQEHDQLLVGVSQFAAVDVDIADLVALEPIALVAGLFLRKPGDPMPLEATVERVPAEVGVWHPSGSPARRPAATASSGGTLPRWLPRLASAPCSSEPSAPSAHRPSWSAGADFRTSLGVQVV